MRRWQPCGLIVLLCLGIFACKKPTTSQVAETISDDQDLKKPIEVSASDLLDKSRSELATQEAEFFDRVTYQNKVLREKPVEAILLDKLRYPLEMPVWQEAKFNETEGLSLPPYLAPGKRDNALAWHLARFGDLESAKKIADENQHPALNELHHAHYERNYPVEWSRLVARIQHLGHLRLVTGEHDGATLLIELHSQLIKTLDPKARQSALGAVLLRQGRLTLKEAEGVWRGGNKPQLADQVKQVLADWGEVPIPTFGSWIGAPRMEIARTLGVSSDEGILSVDDPRRALDVLELPVAREQVEGISLTFDADNMVREILVSYPPQVSRLFPMPANLASTLEEHGLRGKDGPTVAEVRQRQYTSGGANCEVFVLLQNGHVGALVLIRAEKPAPRDVALGRDFDVVHLDAGFDFNRQQLNHHQLGDRIEAKDKETLEDFTFPLPLLGPLSVARLERAPGAQATDHLTLVGDKRRVPTHKLLATLWQDAGPGVWKGVEDPEGGHFALSWEDKVTTYTLRLPNTAANAPAWEAADRSVGKEQSKRDEAALQFDATRRQQRLENKDPWDPLPRSLQIHLFKLGDSRAAVERALPQAEKTSFGLRYVFPDKPAAVDATTTAQKATKTAGKKTTVRPVPAKSKTPAAKVDEPEYSPRQLVLRFDEQNRLAEIRLFVQENTTKNGSMLSKYQALFGVNPPIESSWGVLWKDLPPLKPAPLMAQWRDDITTFTCERSGFGTEMTLRDCNLQHPEGVPLPPFAFLPRGPAELQLDLAREDILAAWKGLPPRPVTDDPLILEPSKPGPYDGFYLWFANGKCIRIVARHTKGSTAKVTPPDRTAAIMKAWGMLIKDVGYWTRCDLGGDKSGQYVKGYGWSDEKTRIRLYWEDDKTGPHLSTEWRALTTEK